MIRFNENKIDLRYNVNKNGEITDLNGNIQKTKMNNERPCFKGTPVHKIVMYTFNEWRDGHKWAIHHIDENKLNNSIDNLIYLTRSEHRKLHMKGNKYCLGRHIKYTKEQRERLSKAHLGQKAWNKGLKTPEDVRKKQSLAKIGKKRKPFTEETKRKMSEARKLYFKNKRESIKC